MKAKILVVALVGLCGTTAALANDDAPVADVVAHYVAMATALAGDTTTGIADHARACLTVVDSHPAGPAGADHDEAAEKMHASIREALLRLSDPQIGLNDARASFKALSAGFVPMAKMMYTKQSTDPLWAVMHCPMADADWIQADGAVLNPYFGSKMLHCGKKVADLAPSMEEDVGSPRSETGHMQHHGGGHH